MKALVEVKRVVDVQGVVHLKFVLGGRVYMSWCAEGPLVDVVVEGPIEAVTCAKEREAFAALESGEAGTMRELF